MGWPCFFLLFGTHFTYFVVFVLLPYFSARPSFGRFYSHSVPFHGQPFPSTNLSLLYAMFLPECKKKKFSPMSNFCLSSANTNTICPIPLQGHRARRCDSNPSQIASNLPVTYQFSSSIFSSSSNCHKSGSQQSTPRIIPSNIALYTMHKWRASDFNRLNWQESRLSATTPATVRLEPVYYSRK